jgi:hypothetical protein
MNSFSSDWLALRGESKRNCLRVGAVSLFTTERNASRGAHGRLWVILYSSCFGSHSHNRRPITETCSYADTMWSSRAAFPDVSVSPWRICSVRRALPHRYMGLQTPSPTTTQAKYKQVLHTLPYQSYRSISSSTWSRMILTHHL